MTDVSWWQRHLGGGATPPPQPVVPTQPVGYPQKAVRWQPSYPPTGPRQEVTDAQPESIEDDNWSRVQNQGFVSKAPSSLGKSGRCPECGGSSFFKRKGPMGSEAAPLCVDCGYNGDLFVQSGTLLNAIGAKSSGPIQFARSDNPTGASQFTADGSVPSDFSVARVR